MDDRTCPICMAMNGYTWTFEAGKDDFGNELFHPTYGVVWNIHMGSKAHGHATDNCRCGMSTRFDLSDLLEKVKIFHDKVKQATQESATNELS